MTCDHCGRYTRKTRPQLLPGAGRLVWKDACADRSCDDTPLGIQARASALARRQEAIKAHHNREQVRVWLERHAGRLEREQSAPCAIELDSVAGAPDEGLTADFWRLPEGSPRTPWTGSARLGEVTPREATYSGPDVSSVWGLGTEVLVEDGTEHFTGEVVEVRPGFLRVREKLQKPRKPWPDVPYKAES